MTVHTVTAVSGVWAPSSGSFSNTKDVSGFQVVGMSAANSLYGVTTFPPNACGAVGPDYFIQVSVGSISLFSKAGDYLGGDVLETFLTVGTHPLNGAYDVSVLYDDISNRWLVGALERGEPRLSTNGIMLAVSDTADPLGNWNRYHLDVGEADLVHDFLAMGFDKNGIYFGMVNYPADYAGAMNGGRYVATNLSTAWMVSGNKTYTGSITPAVALDTTLDAAYWVCTLDGRTSGCVRSAAWVSGSPVFGTETAYQTKIIGYTVAAQASGGVPIDPLNHRVLSAVTRDGILYAARCIGVNVSGTDTDADRDAAEILTFDTASPGFGQTPTRIWDSSETPKHYIFPSVTVTPSGSVVVGMNGCASNTYVNSYLWTEGAPSLIRSGTKGYTKYDGTSRNRWGDVTTTVLDPSDLFKVWTTQQIAGPVVNTWDMWTTFLDLGVDAPGTLSFVTLCLLSRRHS